MSWDDVRTARSVELDPTAAHVLLVIATHADRAGRAWPSVDTIARETRLSRATVQRALRRIEAVGAIKVEQRGGRASRYVFPTNPPPSGADRHPSKGPHSEAPAASGGPHSEAPVPHSVPKGPHCEAHNPLEDPSKDGSSNSLDLKAHLAELRAQLTKDRHDS